MGRKPLPAVPPSDKKLLLVGSNSTGKTNTVTAHVVRLLAPHNTGIGGSWITTALDGYHND